MPYLIGGIFAVLLVIFLIYSGIAVKHAAKFRYLSSRTVYLSLLFTGLASIVILIFLIAFIGYLLSL